MPNLCDFDFAIIGGGASGVLLALRLLRDAPAACRIALIEPGTLGRGVAYGTDNPAHVLNVPAAGMSANADNPGDFVAWLTARNGAADPAAFMPRRDYAAYLATRLAAAMEASAANLAHIRQRATAINPDIDSVQITLDSGDTLHCRHAVLATGNLPRNGKAEHPTHQLPAWDSNALEKIGVADDIAIQGSGLSMVDVMLALEARGHLGQIHVISRHGLLPLAHVRGAPALAFDVEALAKLPLRARLKTLRQAARDAAARDIPWQSLLDALRPHVRLLWQSMSDADQRLFLRHVVRYWDIHRHRIAPEVFAKLQNAIDAQRLHIHAARITGSEVQNGRLLLQLAPRHGADAKPLKVRWLVNATGIETRARGFDDPLRRSLLEQGIVRPGLQGLGFASNADANLIAANDNVQPRLHAIGSLRLGDLWESIAIPDLRQDAATLATKLLASSPDC